MPSTTRKKQRSPVTFAGALGTEQLRRLAGDLHGSRSHPALVKNEEGKYGGIFHFVKGLHLSAHVIYFLRERLSTTGLQISWGQLLFGDDQCSPECDVIIHTQGYHRKWNGNENPVMDFKFIQADNVRAVVSCKSQLTSIDKTYAKALKKYGVDKVFLFAECCPESRFPRLLETAERAGYGGLWCLYFTEAPSSPYLKTNEEMYVDFGDAILKAVTN